MTTPAGETRSTGSPAEKVPSTAVMPAGQQRGTAFGHGSDGAFVEAQAARPEVACASQSSRVLRRRPVGWKRVPTGSPGNASPTWAAEVRTTGMPASVAIRGRFDLGLHAAGADAGRAGPADCERLQVGRATDLGDHRRAGLARIAVVQAVDVGQQHQQIGVHQVAGQRGQPVVVAEADLGGGDGVVLVHDRDDAELEQPGEGPVRVAVVAAPGHVVDGQQHLPDPQAVRRERVAVAGHQQALADRRGRLLGGQVTRPRAQPHRRQPGRDRAGGDQHDLGPGRPGARRGRRRAAGAGPGRSGRAGSATTSRP